MRRASLCFSAALLAAALLAAALTACRERVSSQVTSSKPSIEANVERLAPVVPRFHNEARRLGIDWHHDKGETERKHLPETMAGGGGFLDADGDGRLDVYLVQSANFPGQPTSGRPGNVLYRQREDGTFEDVTDQAGVGDAGFGMGAAAADLENDGDVDLFVTNYGPNVLYRNRGDGTFENVTERAGVGDSRWGTSAAFFDADRDGFVDLYVTNYLAYDPTIAPECHSQGAAVRSYCSPTQFDGEDDVLYRNRGDGTFEDVSEAAGITGFRGKGLGVCPFDFDRDGDDDIVVANDTTPTLLFRNDGAMRFEEVGLQFGISYSEDGVTRAGMGVEAADVDEDGRDDVFITNFTAEVNALYRAMPEGDFREWSRRSGLGAISYPFLGFGTVFFDADLDGDLDVVVANGHVLDTVELSNKATTYEQRPFLFTNDGRGGFTEVGERSGSIFHGRYAGRGLAAGDVDDDGDEDLLLLQSDDSPLLLMNTTERAGTASIVLRLVGTRSNHDAIGAKVEVHLGDRVLHRAVRASRSYLSIHDRRLVIGAGRAAEIDRVRVTWPSGGVDEVASLPTDHSFTIEEGKGVTERHRIQPR